jgi:hypothetical protein
MLLAQHVELNMACRAIVDCVPSRFLMPLDMELWQELLQGLTMLYLNAVDRLVSLVALSI